MKRLCAGSRDVTSEEGEGRPSRCAQTDARDRAWLPRATFPVCRRRPAGDVARGALEDDDGVNMIDHDDEEPTLSTPPTKQEGIAWFAWCMTTGRFEAGTTVRKFAAKHGLKIGTLYGWTAEASARVRSITSIEALSELREATLASMLRIAEKAEAAADEGGKETPQNLRAALEAHSKISDLMGLQRSTNSASTEVLTSATAARLVALITEATRAELDPTTAARVVARIAEGMGELLSPATPTTPTTPSKATN